MKISSCIRSITLIVAISAAMTEGSRAADPAKCDKVSIAVRTATEQSPQKVLVIVEDAMVADEDCAGEIVKAAILASHANADLIKQIVLTATNVAPRLSALIAGSAAEVAPDQAVAIEDTSKNAIEVQPASEKSSDDDYRSAPQDIRGVYLIQPATGATAVTQTVTEKTGKTVVRKEIVRRSPPHASSPQSPSSASAY